MYGFSALLTRWTLPPGILPLQAFSSSFPFSPCPERLVFPRHSTHSLGGVVFVDPSLNTTCAQVTPFCSQGLTPKLKACLLTTQNSALLFWVGQKDSHKYRSQTEFFIPLHEPALHPACLSSGADATTIQGSNLEVNRVWGFCSSCLSVDRGM